MARQKAEQVQRKVLEVQTEDKTNEEPPMSSSGEESDEESEEEEDDLEWLDVSHEEAFAMGESAEKANDLDRAIQCFQQAIKKYVALGNEEASPGAAEYWLAYGHALLKKEEESTDLFNPEQNGEEADDDKQIAWESLDIARVCYEKKICGLVEHGDLKRTRLPDIWSFITTAADAGQPPYQTFEISDANNKAVRNAIFTRLRLGDFCQAHHQFETAVQEFSSALSLCVELGAPPNEALQATVPLAHCLMAADHEHTEAAFRLAQKLIDFELASANTSAVRKSILEELKPDLASQLSEYIQERLQMQKEALEVLETVGFGEQPEGGDAPVDLGRLGKRRKKDSDAKRDAS